MACDCPSIEEAKKHIKSIDFSMIIEKMIKLDGWLKKDAEETCQLYRNFLFLKRKYGSDGINIPPSKDVDEFWHYHILDTEKYHVDCMAIFGRYLPHYPYFGIDKHSTFADLDAAFEKVQNLHFKEFGYYIFTTRQGRNIFINYFFNKISRYLSFL